MNTRTSLAALAALALVASAAALPSSSAEDPGGPSQDLEASQHDGNTSNGGTDGGTSDGSDYNSTDGNQTDGSDGSGNGTESGQADGGAGDSRSTDDGSHDGADGNGQADDRGRSDPGPEQTGPQSREVRVDVDRAKGRAELRSEARDGDARTELRLELRGEAATMALDFENRTEEGRVELKAQVQHALLAEFRDADGDGVRDPGETAVQTIDLRDRDPNVTVEQTTVGPRVITTYPLPGNGTFATTVLLPTGPARVGSQRVTPEEAKVDFRIEGFPYQANGTRLALQVQVEAAYEARVPAAGASGLTLASEDAAAYFRWRPNATVDGALRDVTSRVDAVTASSEDGEARTEYVVHLAYARGEAIVHDPTFGVQSLEEAAQAVRETLGHLPTYVVAAGATAALAAGLAYARTRTGPR